MKRETKKRIMSVLVLIIFSGSIVTYALLYVSPSQNQQVDWVAKLVILIYEKPQPIPAGIGVTNKSKAKLYTLTDDGIIYKSVEEDVTLGEFFDIWGENFNSTCILDYCNNANHSMRMYVNNKEKFSFELYKIKNGDLIIVDYR